MSNSRTVYSTDQGRLCPACGQAALACRCRELRKQEASGDGVVRIGRETKGRKGKGVTLVRGLPLGEDELKQMASRLKQLCGTGGTLKDSVIEIQGDHREKLLAYLQKEGYRAKLAGA
jgi:translation initiation factor 1